MICKGHVENGVIVLDEPADLPEGSEVEVLPVQQQEGEEEAEERIPTLNERLKNVIGQANGLPPDASINLDHYLYGLPKRKP